VATLVGTEYVHSRLVAARPKLVTRSQVGRAAGCSMEVAVKSSGFQCTRRRPKKLAWPVIPRQ
jgi:hypothetical protein